MCLTYTSRNNEGLTPVHQAANEGNLLCLKQLIEFGADFSSTDNRGNRPIDLAKLWGHKHCAKLLATHSWHQEKSAIINEKYELRKSEIRDILARLEQTMKVPEQNRYIGSQAFHEWLKENSGRKQKPIKMVDKEEEARLKEIELKKYVNDVNNRKTTDPIINHPEIWKVSNPYPRYFHEYPGNLRDIYPRHPYTLEPLYWSTPISLNPKSNDLATKLLLEPNQNLIQKVAREKETVSKKTQSKPKYSPTTDRVMFYSNDSVIDLPKKRVPQTAILQKTNDSVFCLSNDVDSLLFQSALNFPLAENATLPSTASTDLYPFMKNNCKSREHSVDILSIES